MTEAKSNPVGVWSATNASSKSTANTPTNGINLLKSPELIKKISEQVLADIDEYCRVTYDSGFRSHLGASLIGRECSRFLWYTFRWCKKEEFDGRMQRLFNRGHREEARFIEWLEGIGFEVWADDLENYQLYYHANSDAYLIAEKMQDVGDEVDNVSESKEHILIAKAKGVEFPQYRVSGAEGHFGGSMDGFAKFPSHYGIDEYVLLEFKTNGTGKGFADLKKDGMQLSKKEHFAQTCTYGTKGVIHKGEHIKFNFVLYLNICKNDDSIHCELVKLDHKIGEQMDMKAERIILSQEPPQRLSDNPTFHKCTYCAMFEICHESKPVMKNCRSCKFAQPARNKAWFCNNFNGELPKDFIEKGCDAHSTINVNKF